MIETGMASRLLIRQIETFSVICDRLSFSFISKK